MADGKLKICTLEPHATPNGINSIAQILHKLQSDHCMLYRGGAVVTVDYRKLTRTEAMRAFACVTPFPSSNSFAIFSFAYLQTTWMSQIHLSAYTVRTVNFCNSPFPLVATVMSIVRLWV